jgi:Family of unknown function (DUF5678)
MEKQGMSKRNLHASIELLKSLWEKYEGKWVAIDGGEFLGASDKYAELLNKFKDRKDVIITRLV